MNAKDVRQWEETAFTGGRLVRADAYRRALAFMNEKGVLEEFVDREVASAVGTHPVNDKTITSTEGD